MDNEKFILTESQKITLDMYLYTHKDYDLVFGYLEKIGVDKNDYNAVIKQLNKWI